MLLVLLEVVVVEGIIAGDSKGEDSSRGSCIEVSNSRELLWEVMVVEVVGWL